MANTLGRIYIPKESFGLSNTEFDDLINGRLHQYTIHVHCRKISSLFVRALESQKREVRSSDSDCFAASTNEFDIFRQCTCIVFILQFIFYPFYPWKSSKIYAEKFEIISTPRVLRQ